CGGPERVILITDHSVYKHNPSDYPEGDIRSAIDLNFNSSGELSGSRLTMIQAVKNMKHYTEASIIELFKMAAVNPAKAIRVFDNVGSLEAGKLANIILLDNNLDLKKVFLRGVNVS
ncbi:MAG: amidohydrolase family protein, partial [Spirochaetaceae bacterium]|nr:amidohydrolase family protein [Spirochaetaceae bacterium]